VLLHLPAALQPARLISAGEVQALMLQLALQFSNQL
jgi:hypothetical protein